MLGESRTFSYSPARLINSIKHELSCKIFCLLHCSDPESLVNAITTPQRKTFIKLGMKCDNYMKDCRVD